MQGYYEPIFTYKPTLEELRVSRDFALRVAPTTYEIYKKRDPKLTKERHIENHFESAITEIASMHFLISKGCNCSKPDFTIHSKKNFGADLKASRLEIPDITFDIHVKSQTVGLMKWCETPSYSFTTTDKLIERPKYNDLLVLTLIKEDKTIDIISVEDCEKIFPRFVRATKKPMKDKVAIYWNDIVKNKLMV